MDRADFWSKVDQSGDCWIWTAARLNGYGILRLDGKTFRAPRVAWELTNGPITAGLWVLHNCDNPPCVRPEHLRLGNQIDNVRDAVIRGRMPTGDRHWSHRHPEIAAAADHSGNRRGSAHPHAKITEADVIAIRQARAAGRSGRSLAREYGVTDSLISDVVRRVSWAWLE